ncbi:prophage DNA circulation protein [Hymenobacter sp. UYAg731]
MAASLATLTTRAECDEALTGLTAELATYQHRDSNLSYADGLAETRATTTAARLAKATDDVAHYTTESARAGLTPAEKLRAQNSLITATAQRDRLTLATGAQTGSVAYLADVDADQIDAQIATLTAAQTAVTAHRATLAA